MKHAILKMADRSLKTINPLIVQSNLNDCKIFIDILLIAYSIRKYNCMINYVNYTETEFKEFEPLLKFETSLKFDY